ncbi:DsrE family protein [Pontibacter sp. JAM-7]|uniref:DsrE family protein n=1 Tax=Pontibacter sp. JAM-7 TaxID=3366581 RepID=UPI003AF7FF48
MNPLSRFTLTILIALFCLASQPQLNAEPTATPIKVVYHIDDASVGRFALAIAADQLQTNPQMQIAMVTYAAGVDFLLQDAKDSKGRPYAPAVQALLEQGVEFKVCAATLKFRDIARDSVLTGMQFVPAGTYEVIRLQAEEGYVYLKP